MDTVIAARAAFSFDDLQASVAKHGPKRGGVGTKPDPQFTRFLRQIHDNAIADDLDGVGVDDLASLSLAHWKAAASRTIPTTLIEIDAGRRANGDDLGRDVMFIITDDKPFLVDTVMGEINAQGGDVLAMFHPIVTISRDQKGKRSKSGTMASESMIQVHLAPLTAERRNQLVAGIRAALADLDVAVRDHADMRAQMDTAIDELKVSATNASTEDRDEAVAFLRWLRNDHFAFLGCRSYEYVLNDEGDYTNRDPIVHEDQNRGVLRDPDRFILRDKDEPAIITSTIAEFLRAPNPVGVGKSNMESRVHRRTAMDYISVKRYRADGEVIGETRFVGLFTAEAYLTAVADVPLIRRKVQRVLDLADGAPGSHSQKRLKFILDTYPREELFEADVPELCKIAMGMLHLFDRPRPRLFTRRDKYDRYVSVFAFIPRERFSSDVRAGIGDMLADAYRGELRSFTTTFTNSPLARVHFIIGLDRSQLPARPNTEQLEQRIAAFSRTWEDDFERQASAYGQAGLAERAAAYTGAFSAGYQERYTPDEAVRDAEVIEKLCAQDAAGDIAVRVFPTIGATRPEEITLKLYQTGTATNLSVRMELLETLGLSVVSEVTFPVRRSHRDAQGRKVQDAPVLIYDFQVEAPRAAVDFDTLKPALEDTIIATWRGDNEADRFNTLTAILGLPWRDVCFLRTCARYRQQTGEDPSQPVQEQALADNPELVQLILELRDARFDPDFSGARTAKQDEITKKILKKLDDVASLDADRVLRRIANLVAAVQRTNFYQTTENGTPKPYIALKIASSELENLPEPKPYREIFVWSPRVEGVHIRFGPIARGGLRWSDRRDDFRKEVLDLVKAQQVKNAVIVPVGSKGGFFPKHLPRNGDRQAMQAEAIAAYKTFISGLLDVTDNLNGNDVLRPPHVHAWDGDDPYLVVAADKGTATFSDIANGISVERGFWLGDAFASGGSVGYDHKAMGITARGAWVAVQRHFRERGKDIQNEPFTVIGVGDMSGDVFGNGMLLSKHIKLVAAFDHRDIFIDPNPADPAVSWKERKRLFDQGRSTWQDYNTDLISKGGGIFPRSQKSITLNPQIKALTGLTDKAVAPFELIRALLKSDVELLWFGGIGTYIREAGETDDLVGDRANDMVRITAGEVGAAVVGEGANLGSTQAGRIAMARRGIKLNADFIDNAAGVDTSDHEVNIKILLNAVMADKRLDDARRTALLEEMTDDVAAHVLRHNYDQTLAISLAEASAPADLDAFERLIGRLEDRGELNRVVEGLPSSEEFRELKDQGLGLTRPEIGLVIGYAKIAVFNRLLESGVPDDPHFVTMLEDYFPKALKSVSSDIHQHRLRREIIATVLANDLVNLGGPTFVHRAREATGGETRAVASAFQAARSIFGLMDVLRDIHALDNKVPANVQLQLYQEIITVLRRQTYWLVRRGGTDAEGTPKPLDDVIAAYRPGVEALQKLGPDIASNFEQERHKARVASFVSAGAPKALAKRIGALRMLISSSDVIDLASAQNVPLELAARVYHAVADAFGFDRLRTAAGELSSTEHWDRLAVRRLIEDLYAHHYALAKQALALSSTQAAKSNGAAGAAQVGRQAAKACVDRLRAAREEGTHNTTALINELDASGPWTLSKLSIVSSALRDLAEG